MTEQRFEARDEETNSEYLYSLTSAISESEIGLVVASSRLSRRSGVLSVSVGRRQLPAHALTGKRQEGGDREGRGTRGAEAPLDPLPQPFRVVEIP